LRSASTSTNNNNIQSSANSKIKYFKPPGSLKQVLKVGQNNISVSSDNNKDSFVSNQKNIASQIENIMPSQNNYINTLTNIKNSRKTSTNSNQSYLLNFKEKQKLTTSNSKNIEKKGNMLSKS
jgi:hypothetical protein